MENKPSELIHAAMIHVLSNIKAIQKDRENKQQGFKFRGIDDVYNELHSLFAAAGIYMTTEVLSSEAKVVPTKSGGTMNYVTLTCKFFFRAEDGSSVSSIVQGEASDSGDKGTNKAMAIAHKYCLFQAFLIPTEDEKDPDSQSNDVEHPAGQKQSAPVRSAVSTGYQKKETVETYTGEPEQVAKVKEQARAIGIKTHEWYVKFNEFFANKPMKDLVELIARFVKENPQALVKAEK